MMSFYNELKGDGLSKEKKDAIEVRLRGQGFEDVTWNGIRIFNNEVTMADKSGKWNNPVLLESLVMAFHGLAKSADGLTKESKDAVVAKAHLWGFTDITWEGIRYLCSCLVLCFKWTPEIDQQILAAMVKVMIPTAEQYNAIMEELEPCGYGFTAITMKIQHIMAPVTIWDDKAHADLLIALLPVVKPTKDQWDEVLANVRAKGYNYTAGAVVY
ncbi:hypothetical protein CCHR01_12851 [Colletotrichum chrysophilum]|uniref:Uncharacterized protein n=1 Tax=Colletotrichum chrysophilum TaxID=1836956 RepID=A0AAD9ADB2_9PEZI|nr:hypothetical protein CCHR01_12851 [Colletotrichum chrysophilum]